MKIKGLIATLLLVVFFCALGSAQDPGWPRKNVQSGNTLVSYAPQIDQWQDYKVVTWRQAFQLTPAGGEEVVGAATLTGNTLVDNDQHIVLIGGIKVTNTYFPGLDPTTASTMDQLLRSMVPDVVNVSLERVVACMPKPQSVNTVALNNTPPFIFVSYSPAILLGVDGEPVLAQIPDTKLKFVVNTHWALFFETETSQYYLSVGQRWLTARDPHGPWSVTKKLPKDMTKLPGQQQWAGLKAVIPAPSNPSGPIPAVFYSTSPSEIILFDGRPNYVPIPNTQLVFASNTDSPFFLYKATNEYYYLTSGRWFKTANLGGQWTFASLSLPADFAQIPLSSPASAVLASVPGTEEAKDAVLIAQVPTVIQVDPLKAAAQVNVTYTGDPKFAPIDGTSLYYATNTADKVIQVGDVYYLCLQGIWFMSPNPQGPWTTASSVPQSIYSIPPSSPVYNVTYVTQTTTPSGDVQSSYTAGYLGAFVMGAAMGAIVANGTGYYYPPYIGYPAYGYPVYHPYATPYGAYGYGSYYHTATGAYGVSQTAYGPYGSATRAASYNPYTGTYARGASASTAYGTQSVAQAYNPYTGTYAASHQGSSPTAQWGQSYVSNGNRSAYTQHYSTAQGTVASAQGSRGGAAVGSSTAYGNSAVGKTASGDMYAGHDGNVYKNTGDGWQKYGSDGWSSVNAPQPQQAEQRAQGFNQQSMNQERSSSGWSSQNLNSEAQSRMSGAEQSDRFQQHQSWGGGSGGGGSWGGGHSWGGYGGGGRSWGGGGGGWGGRRR